MKNYYTVIFLLFTLSFFGQDKNDKKIYLDSLNEETNEMNYLYYRIIKDYELDKKIYAIEDYYNSNVLKMKGTCLDREGYVKDGEFNFYYENGKLRLKNIFSNNNVVGLYTQWYENGNVMTEGKHFKHKESKDNTSIINHWDENNIQTVISGNGNYKLKTKNFEISGLLKEGRREDKWLGFDYAKKISFEEFYNNGDLIKGTSTDSNGKFFPYTEVFVSTLPQKGMQHLKDYIAKNAQISNLNVDVNDKVILQLTINKNGKLKEIKVAKSLGYDIDEVAIEVIKNYKENWIPAKNRGVVAEGKASLPIVFNLLKK